MFNWLKEFNLLSEYGIETFNDGIDEEAIITDEMLNDSGKRFLDQYYDEYISSVQYGIKEDSKLLEKLYYKF